MSSTERGRAETPIDDGDADTGPIGPFPVARATGRSPIPALAVPVLGGFALAVLLGVYGRLHEPGAVAVDIAGFSGPAYVKAWLTTVATLLAVVQLVSALNMYGRIGHASPSWVPAVHRWTGRLAVLVTVPVVVHCLYAFGFEYDSPRVLVHSLAGCLFYGAFATKMLSLPRRDLPGWTLPVVGGVVFSALVALWLTAALWLFTTRGLHL
ncbi:DUF6529 family protein [Actinomycetospora sp.]|jgi:hypothetical protein|uniref:DUF6529 family protein n=1 Tax=Actinomycetospora sp. TaxID=1872135 RepID=UPI002F3FC28B